MSGGGSGGVACYAGITLIREKKGEKKKHAKKQGRVNSRRGVDQNSV